MNANKLSEKARALVAAKSDLVERHLDFLKRMIAIDSRSFGVGEFQGDRTTPSDMVEILTLAEEYLVSIGFSNIRINQSSEGKQLPNPILMAEIIAGARKPTLLFYAHLDKQPYMDDGRFLRWKGVPPTEARWNENRTRLYGRGAADDLAGVTAIGMTVDALLQTVGFDSTFTSSQSFDRLPCNVKVIYETEEESGSHTLIDQIRQNWKFFADVDCVLITDVINPATGYPGLTTSLRGITQIRVELEAEPGFVGMDSQTALYKLVASLIDDNHYLAVSAIADADTIITDEEAEGYGLVPTTVEALRSGAGILPGVRLIVSEDKSEMIQSQLRRSFVNVRPGNRVSGSIIFGVAGARLTLDPPAGFSRGMFEEALQSFLNAHNDFQLELIINEVSSWKESILIYDLILRAAIKDPHSGVHGGPFPIAELQLAKMIDRLIRDDGTLHLENGGTEGLQFRFEALHVDPDLTVRTFSECAASAIVEIRLGAGNNENEARLKLKEHLYSMLPSGFQMSLQEEKGASPWITGIKNSAFPAIMDSLEKGYGHKPCLYGCGGSIPFVPKLMDAFGNVPPICLGVYDPDSKMHEPGESLSLSDWLGCARSMIDFAAHSGKTFQREL